MEPLKKKLDPIHIREYEFW